MMILIWTVVLSCDADEANFPVEGKDERVFLLDESLHFRSSITKGSVVLAWRDLSGDPGDVYKFICDLNTQPGVSHTFELVGNFPLSCREPANTCR
jgi:hypothetical protein